MKIAYRVYFMRCVNLTTCEIIEKPFIFKSSAYACNAAKRLATTAWGQSNAETNDWYILLVQDVDLSTELKDTHVKLQQAVKNKHYVLARGYANWAATLEYIARYGKY